MKDFVKMMLASAMGYMMATFFLGLFFFFGSVVVIAVLAAFGDQAKQGVATSVKTNSVLVLNVEGELSERRPISDVFQEIIANDNTPYMGLYEIGKSLKLAATDNRIRGVYLRLRWLSAGWGKTEALRKMLLEFKKSGKFIWAYSEVYDEKLYYLATTADEIFMYPKGDFDWNGIYSKLSFFKKTLRKLEVEPILIRAGKFKAAGESIIRESMSEENREQTTAIIDSLWSHVTASIFSVRPDLNPEFLSETAETLSVIDAQQAYNKSFVTQLSPVEDIEVKLKERLGMKPEKDLRLISWSNYLALEEESSLLGGSERIAVVVANGEIRLGKGDPEENVYSDELSALVRELTKDEKVKAVVLRVNSPGGSALASDVIWRSFEYLKKEKKTFVSSFSDVAASGGYYISAGSDYIFAEPTTITGSIGVFGLLFNTTEFFDHKLGVTFDEAKTHEHADMMTGRALSPYEVQKVQDSVDRIYQTFLSVVAEGRTTMETTDDVHELAQGRVWTGAQALENGLVDGLGSLDDAVAKAAELAQLDDYEVVMYPSQKKWIEKVIESIGEGWAPQWVVKLLKPVEQVLSPRELRSRPVMTRMPFSIEFE